MMITERIKKKSYHRIHTNDYFWRTYSQKEIDLIEERDGRLFAFEFKWKEQSYRPPSEWLSGYPDTAVELITRRNYLPFVK